MNEQIDVLNENGIKLGYSLSRKEVHEKGLWHRAIIVAIVNEENQLLIQQRAASKEKNANMWDISVAGHISAGQDSLSAATREINEEVSVDLGSRVDVREFRFMTSFRSEIKYSDDFIERQFYDFFVLRREKMRPETITYQESEVQAVKFVSLSELSTMRANGELVDRENVYDVLVDYLFRM